VWKETDEEGYRDSRSDKQLKTAMFLIGGVVVGGILGLIIASGVANIVYPEAEALRSVLPRYHSK